MFKELDFPVNLLNIPHPSLPGEMIEDRKAIVRSDTNEVLNIVSNRYQLVKHVDVFNPVNEAIERLGLPVKNVSTSLGDRGGSARVTWTLDRQISIVNGGSDVVDLRVIARNSYDYSKMLGLQLGGLRLVCTNGLTVGHILASYDKRHVPSLSVEVALQRITAMLEQQEKVQRAWNHWAQIEYLPPRFAKWLEERPSQVSKRAREEVVDYFTTQPDRRRAGMSPHYTGWEAYNSLTWYGTHRIRTRTEDRQLVASELVAALADDFAASELRN